MRILLCNPRGFCAGVNMAIECVDRVLKLKGPPVYVYHEIVHNRHVVKRFTDQGVIFVDCIEDVPAGSTVVYSAHGVSPEVRSRAQARHLTQIDATCPLVAKVHSEAVRYARQKFAIVLIGHANHDEVVGTFGEAPDSIHMVQSAEDVLALDLPQEHRIVYLTQTTLSLDEADVVISALRAKYPHIRAPEQVDICYATTNRQRAVQDLAQESDLVLVVGSRNSSNSMRLVEAARNRGIRACLVDDVSCLDLELLKDVETVLLTAGASAPEDLVQGIVRFLESAFHATVEERELIDEDMDFELPLSLRRLEVLER